MTVKTANPRVLRPETQKAAKISAARWRFLMGERLLAWAQADLARASIWSPVALGIGAGGYFGLKQEPASHHGMLALGVCCLAVWVTTKFSATRFGALKIPAFALMFVALGFVAADWRAASVEAPQLSRDLGIVEISGRLETLEVGDKGRRYVIALDHIEGLSPENRPAKARITWRGKEFDAHPGDHISLRAGLSPPPPPVTPGGFDFARQLYFYQIGAVGFAVSPPVVDQSAERNLRQRFAASVETMRVNLFSRIVAKAPGEGGAIIAAIVTGKRDAITERAEAALRDAGLAHLLAISGLHMGLATGLVFFVVRSLLAAIEPVSLRFPIKKWAAATALCSGAFYLILSGGGWSARRAFIMAAIMFVAILVDRRALSLRNVSIAAVIILLLTPEALFHPGFQMSFAAVAGLIATYEWLGTRAKTDRLFSWQERFRRYAIALAATDVIAAIATAPYALFHFNRVALYSLPANMAAMPLMGFWIVPTALIALLLAPLGIDGWAWRMSAFGMEVVLAIASEVSSWRGAVSLTPQWPLGAMLSLTFGGLWLCFSRVPWRLAGLAAIPLAALMAGGGEKPILYVAPSGLNAGIVVEGEFAVYNLRKDRFAIGRWKEAAGIDPLLAATKPLKAFYPCDEWGCVAPLSANTKVAFVTDKTSLAEDCGRAQIVIAFYPVHRNDSAGCNAQLIDRRAVWHGGAHAVYVTEGGIRVQTANEIRGDRPWTGAP
ncbi:ComEC/Rec2 family competence protein [Hyphococcus lacteus]|uniref:ComEC/Rec2 family competence protein n=1 Tax=Hyphococcus lacteus TaxID=3143536 RepID=A0ABV3Z9P8_9PROT